MHMTKSLKAKKSYCIFIQQRKLIYIYIYIYIYIILACILALITSLLKS